MSIENELLLHSQILQYMSEGVALIRTQNGEIVFTNPAFVKIFGYEPGELLYKNVSILNAPTERSPEETAAEIISHLKTFGQWRGEILNLKKNGTPFWTYTHVSSFEHPEFGQVWITVKKDISERKQIEAERERLYLQTLYSQRMETLGHLTNGIAHNFNNILAEMMGFADLATFAIEDKKKNACTEILEYLSEIQIAGNRAKELISQMQIFNQQQDKISDDKTTAIILQPVIKEAVKLLRATLPATIDINSHIEDPKLTAKISALNLHQILLNLGINAQRAISEHGRINIDCKKRSLSEKCSSCHGTFGGDYIEISVSDTGKGLPEEILSRVFDPFFTTKEIGEGSGMGLSIVHGLVHASSGHITVTTKKNEGTTVSIFLP